MPRLQGPRLTDILDAQRALHPPQLSGTPIHPRNPLCCPGEPRQDRHCARSGEDSLLCPGMRRALQPRPPPDQLPRGAEAAGATLRRAAYLSPRGSGGQRRAARRPRAATAGTSSARSSCKKWPSERRRGGQEGRGGAGARVLPWLHLAGPPSPEGAKRPSSAKAAARPSCGEQRRRWQRPRRAGSRLRPAP